MEHLIWNLGAFLNGAWLYLTTRDLLIGLMSRPDFRIGMWGGEEHATAIDLVMQEERGRRKKFVLLEAVVILVIE